MGCFMMTAETKKKFTEVDMSEYMISDRTEAMQAIRNIEDKYGLILFRMGLSHLTDVGHRNLTDENVEDSIRQIMAKGEANEISVMTPEFQCEIVRCSGELARFSIWTLFAYIKQHVHVDVC